MGIVTFIVLLIIELIFFIWSILTKASHSYEKNIVRLTEFVLLIVMLITGVFQWSFRYYMILAVLTFQAAMALMRLVKKNQKKPFKLSKMILSFVSISMLYFFSLSLAVVFPQYRQPEVTGNLKVATAKYTWTDETRIETFTNTGENRNLTVEFWYPDEVNEKYPLVVFSHGAFGFSGSNYSTFEELASNGYVVASIGHTYHAFYTQETNGKVKIVNFNFLNTVMSEKTDEEAFKYSMEWLKLRLDDVNFVLDRIQNEANKDKTGLFSLIDTEKIGLMGHSLGGASSAQLGRDRKDIDAVIVLDGTMFGEKLAFENGKVILNEAPYPVPLLNIYAEDHYNNAMEFVGPDYDNFYASENAVCAYEVTLKNAGHLNFTDLPLFSPLLAKVLGTGSVDSRYCIEITNKLVKEFFDCYLKNISDVDFQRVY